MKNIIKFLNGKSPVINVLLLLSAFVTALIIFQSLATQNFSYFFLIWNLFLAWVPLLLVKIWLLRLQHGHLSAWKQFGMYVFWLLFWPNAPYLITDLVHINDWFKPILWVDILLFFMASLTGLLLALYSIYKVHFSILITIYGNLRSSWIIYMSIIIASYGIYLGRVQRWNSWDILTNPISLLKDSILNIQQTEAWTITIGFSLLLGITYYTMIKIIQYAKS